MITTTDVTQIVVLSGTIIAQFIPRHQNLLPDFKELFKRDLTTWDKRLDAKYAKLQELDASLRRALGESENGKTDLDQHDDLIAMLDYVHQEMTDIEEKRMQGPDWLLLDGGADE